MNANLRNTTAVLDQPPMAGPKPPRPRRDLRTCAPVAEATAVLRNPGPSRSANKWLIARIMLVLLVSSVPILAISAHVFGFASKRTTALVVLLPLVAALAVVIAIAPHRTDGIIGRGLVAGMIACAVYDGARLFAVLVLHRMGDFIPTMGTWITGDPDIHTGTVIGYIWRYFGDGGGLGVAFFFVALAVGLDRWTNRPSRVVLAAVGYAVFPVWAGLIATVAFARDGQKMMFPLNANTIVITLVGHVVFGFVLGLCFVRASRTLGGHELRAAIWGNRWSPALPWILPSHPAAEVESVSLRHAG